MNASLISLFLNFLKIGAFTFGGGYAMIPLFEREFVHNYKYIDEEEFADILVICQSLPGVIAVNFAVFIGMSLRGKKGAFVSALGVTLPSFIIIMVIAAFLYRFVDHEAIVAIFNGVRIAVVALIFSAGVKFLKKNLHFRGVFLALLTFTMVGIFYIHPFFVIGFLALLGYLIHVVSEVTNHVDAA
ncbi:MAG: chromate transporter [Candidatus Izemoplasmataceae bacterium]